MYGGMQNTKANICFIKFSLWESKKLPITEKNPTNPLNFYGLTKLTNEKQIKLFNKNYNIDYIILRFLLHMVK